MSAAPSTPDEDQCPECFRFGSGHKMTCSLDESPGRIAVPVFDEVWGRCFTCEELGTYCGHGERE